MTFLVKFFLVLSLAVSLANAFAPMSRTILNTKKSTSIIPSKKHFAQRSQVGLHLKDENMTEEERAIALEKATKAMTAFSNTYIKNTGTKYCSDLSIPAVVIKGLAEHKVTLGAPLCPCRFYEDKEKEAKDGFWNCP
jgi:Ferredoxin-thioredoxin reductase, catalytic subunit